MGGNGETWESKGGRERVRDKKRAMETEKLNFGIDGCKIKIVFS